MNADWYCIEVDVTRMSPQLDSIKVVKLILLRHAKAGSRSHYEGNDIDRNITVAGRLQAEALVAESELQDASLLISSPYTRCVQTLEPIAGHLGIAIDLDRRLAEGSHESAIMDWYEEVRLGDRSAIACSHGDVIPFLIEKIASKRGIELFSLLCAKGSYWSIDFETGEVSSLVYVDPGSIFQSYKPSRTKAKE